MKNKNLTFDSWVNSTSKLDFDADDGISDDAKKMIINACFDAYVTGKKNQRLIDKARSKAVKS